MIFRRFFLSDSTEKLREEPSNVSESFKCEVLNKILNKNGVSRFSVENFSARSVERFRCGTLRYITKGRLSKNFMPKRVITLFSVDFFSRIMPINSLRNPSLFQNLWDIEDFMLRGGHRDFPLVFLASQKWKLSWVTPSTVRKTSSVETFSAWERKITFFCRNFFVSQYQTNSW